jgi:hypothetical protein
MTGSATKSGISTDDAARLLLDMLEQNALTFATPVASNTGSARNRKGSRPMTSAERARILKAKRAEQGLVQCNVWVPLSAVPTIQAAAELIRSNPQLAVARLVDRSTGRLTGLKGKA